MGTRVGVGSDFSDLDTHPQFHAAWADIEAKIRSDGGPNLDLNLDGAQKLLARTYNDLVSNELHIDVGDAIAHAKSFVIAGRTIEGAIGQVQGLINSSTSGAPPTVVVQQFTGILIGVAVAAGLSAGVGALIAAGVGVGIEILRGLHLFDDAKPGTVICNVTWSPPPDWTVGCIGMYLPPGMTKPVPSPANVGWRVFPGIGIGGSIGIDAHWFADTRTEGAVFNGVKNIQAAFPAYERLQCDLKKAWPPAVADFHKAFYAAWRANNEYALNGLKSQPDWVVLKQLLLTWNAAHEPGTPFGFEARGNDLNSLTDVQCTSAIPYIAIMVDAATREDPQFGNWAPGSAIRINTGPRKTRSAQTTAVVASTSTASSVAKGALWIAGLGLVGVGVYSFATKRSFTGVLKSGWRKTGTGFKKALHLRGRR